MKTPSPTKSPTCSPIGHGYTSPDRKNYLQPANLISDKLTVMGHSMISRSGDPESELVGLNVDLRLITGRMAQTLQSYEVKHAKHITDQIKSVQDHLSEISNPILQLQVKMILDNYKSMAAEREDILGNLENWFTNCSDEFLEELVEFESQFEGEDTLSDNISHAKDLIAKIKFINRKIIDFQGNGMSTEKLIAQKKTLEAELIKKKVIVDNTKKGSEAYTTWRTNVENLLSMIKESSANEIDKAIIDLKLTEAADHVTDTLISLERTSRRVGVLFKNVKELEYNNGMLAEENSFLKQRLSQIDKHFKDVMTKKKQKLDATLTDIHDVKHLTSGSNAAGPDSVNMRLGGQGNGISMEMEMIEGYQQTIHTLDNENKELISKVDKFEEDNDDLKEEIKTLDQKLKMEEHKSKNAHARSTANLAMVKLDNDSGDQSAGSEHSLAGNKSQASVHINTVVSGFRSSQRDQRPGSHRRNSSMVSTITFQDGKEMETLKMDNESLRHQLQRMKISLNSLRKQQNKPKRLNKSIQTKTIWNTPENKLCTSPRTPTPDIVSLYDEDEEDEVVDDDDEEDEDDEDDDFIEGDELPSYRRRKEKKKGKKKTKTPRKKHTRNSDANERLSDSIISEESYSSSEESSELEIEEAADPKAIKEKLEERKRRKSEKLVSGLQKYVNKQEKSLRKAKRRKSRLENEESVIDIPQNETNHAVQVYESESESSGSEIEKKKKSRQTPAELITIRKSGKKAAKKQKGSILKKPKVKFEQAEPEPEPTPEVEPPSFQRIPTPKIEEEDPIVCLGKIREELKEFLSYGHKFISSIYDCITDTADAELMQNIDQYAGIEQQISSVETSLNMVLYGVDLGMTLTPSLRPAHSPIPFENKLYFRENLSKYLRAKYPKLNVNAMKMFDPDLMPRKELPMQEERVQAPSSPTFKPYSGYTTTTQHGFFSNFKMPLTTTPEPKLRKSPRKVQKRKLVRKDNAIGKLEEIMAGLTLGSLIQQKNSIEKGKVLDNRTFAEIVDHVMPKEIAMKYLKLVQPTQDTLGKRQYYDKLKRGAVKVKDLMDLVNINPNPSVLKGLPTNQLGEPRTRQTKVHKHNLVVTELLKGSSPAPAHFPAQNYRNKLVQNDERVRASLDDYALDDVELRTSTSLTVMEVPLTSRGIQEKRKERVEEEHQDPKEDMFDLSKSNPNIDLEVPGTTKRGFLPVVTQNLLPHSETKKFPPRTKKLKKSLTQPQIVDDIPDKPPKVSDILNMGWKKPSYTRVYSDKLPSINKSKENKLTD